MVGQIAFTGTFTVEKNTGVIAVLATCLHVTVITFTVTKQAAKQSGHHTFLPAHLYHMIERLISLSSSPGFPLRPTIPRGSHHPQPLPTSPQPLPCGAWSVQVRVNQPALATVSVHSLSLPCCAFNVHVLEYNFKLYSYCCSSPGLHSEQLPLMEP